MKTATPKFKRGDVVRVVVSGKTLVASIVAACEKPGKPVRFRCLTEANKTVDREATGLKPGEEKDREKLTAALAEVSEK